MKRHEYPQGSRRLDALINRVTDQPLSHRTDRLFQKFASGTHNENNKEGKNIILNPDKSIIHLVAYAYYTAFANSSISSTKPKIRLIISSRSVLYAKQFF
jgi:hypothetical protein